MIGTGKQARLGDPRNAGHERASDTTPFVFERAIDGAHDGHRVRQRIRLSYAFRNWRVVLVYQQYHRLSMEFVQPANGLRQYNLCLRRVIYRNAR